MSTVRKSRELPFGGGFGHSKVWSHNAFTDRWTLDTSNSGSHRTPRDKGYQITDSESHNWPPQGGSGSDVGGGFYTEIRRGSQPSTRQGIDKTVPTGGSVTDKRRYQVGQDLRTPIPRGGTGSPVFPSKLSSAQSVLNALGATAISRCRPTSSAAELSVAMGETYKDGLPHLVGAQTWRERTLQAKNAGDEYLNTVFGWVPLVNDITDFSKAVSDSGSILNQYDADKGHVIRRRYSFPTIEERSEQALGSATPEGVFLDSGALGLSSPGLYTVTTVQRINRWFSGAFVYGVPNGIFPGGPIADQAAKADKLLGVSLTPDVLWNLSPWSWAADWFTNVGDVLSTVSDMASQGLVMQYGYFMEHTVHEKTYSLANAAINGQTLKLPSATLVTETKSRSKASPFGFGITWDGFNSSQLAILAALGISRT